MLSLKTKPFPRSQSADEHRRILDFAIKRDRERASRLLAEHILKAARMVVEPRHCEEHSDEAIQGP
jgi:DNA-binding GntR family transcriptional regulator